MRIAVLGMGKMGHAVAGRLLDHGHEMTVWNRSAGKAGDLVGNGASEASSPSEAVASAEVVVTSLADDTAVLSVLEDGVAESLQSVAVLCDMSTVSPATAGKLSEAVNGRFLASPILGAPSAVSSGEAAYLVGGRKEHFDHLAALFGDLSEKARYVGDDPRRALEMKLLANYLLLGGLALVSEAVATAQAIGLSDDVISEFLSSSPLVAPGLRNRIEQVVQGRHDGWFQTTLGAKDVRLLEDLATERALRLPLAELVKRRYEEAAAEGHGDEDITAVVELLRAQ